MPVKTKEENNKTQNEEGGEGKRQRIKREKIFILNILIT
jgi:hypothetical protein